VEALKMCVMMVKIEDGMSRPCTTFGRREKWKILSEKLMGRNH
jgi:hypothetical protein